MDKMWQIRSVKPKTRLKARILSTAKHISLSQLIEELVDKEWESGEIKANHGSVKKIERIIDKYPDAAHTITE